MKPIPRRAEGGFLSFGPRKLYHTGSSIPVDGGILTTYLRLDGYFGPAGQDRSLRHHPPDSATILDIHVLKLAKLRANLMFA